MDKNRENKFKSLNKITGPSQSGTATVTLVLDMKPYNFERIRSEFVSDLSNLLNIELTDIEILAVRDGCTEVDIKIPADSKELLDILRSNGKDWPEDVQNFLRKYKLIPDPNTFHIIIRRNPTNDLAWLHLSDAHFEAADSGSKRHYWGQDKVREAFLKQLPDLLKESSLSPDFVFFTGDIAFSGKKEEYSIALNFISQLRKSLPKNDEARIMLVPGNHDIDRNTVNRYPREEEFAKSFLNSNDSVIQYINSPKHEPDRERVFQRQDNFLEFSSKCKEFGQPELNHKYFFTTEVEHKKVRVGIAGLNSAWRASSDADRYNLIIGIPQLDKAVNDLKDTDLKLMLTHHPPDTDWFLVPDLLYQRDNLHNFDFVLRGHEHDPRTEVTTFSGKQQYCRISAGALYSSDKFPKSFNAVHVDFDTGLATVFYWRLSENTYKWIKDLEIYPQGNNRFLLPNKLRSRLKRRVLPKRVGRSRSQA